MGYFFQEVLLLWTGAIYKNIGFFQQLQVLLFRASNVSVSLRTNSGKRSDVTR